MDDFIPATVAGYSEWPKGTPNYWALPAFGDALRCGAALRADGRFDRAAALATLQALKDKPPKATGAWDLPKVLIHAAQSVEYLGLRLLEEACSELVQQTADIFCRIQEGLRVFGSAARL